MFKLESYITPIILSYVEKYVKNVRAEHSQVSGWGVGSCLNYWVGFFCFFLVEFKLYTC